LARDFTHILAAGGNCLQFEFNCENIAGLKLDVALRKRLETFPRGLHLITARFEIQETKHAVAGGCSRKTPAVGKILQDDADTAQAQASLGSRDSLDGRGGG
jgi:hypothetical protein